MALRHSEVNKYLALSLLGLSKFSCLQRKHVCVRPTSSQWDIDVPDDVVLQAVENFGNFLSKEEKSETVETATPEDLARLDTDGKQTNNVLLSETFTGASINITVAK